MVLNKSAVELDRFFGRYAESFLKADAEFIASVYEFPMTFYTEAGEAVAFTEEAFNNNSKNLIALYKELGVAAVNFERLDQYELSDCLSIVTLKWYFCDDAGAEIYNATTRYLMGLKEDASKIKAVFVIDETSKIAAVKKGMNK
ncbi:MAG: hypothetical protein OIF51_04580 [Cellvibrionaceae bacterium]|nr:hypothetical protein [Cellvibrionaceae bacterium]